MTVLGGTGPLVLAGDVSGVPFVSSLSNGGEIRFSGRVSIILETPPGNYRAHRS